MKIVISDTPPYFLNLDAPTFPAVEAAEAGRTVWRVWCRHCETWHVHGPGEGHREAHCAHPASPYARTGYNVARSVPARKSSESK